MMIRKSAQCAKHERRHYADEYSRGDAAEHKNREIEEYAKIFDEGCSHEQLSHVMEDSRSHTYTGH